MQDIRVQKPEGGPKGGRPWPGAGGWPRHLAAWARGAIPQAALWPIFSPRSENSQEQPRYAILSTVPPLK